MAFQTGFSGIPVNIPLVKIGGSKEGLKQWEDLDKKKKEQKEEKKLREVRKTKRITKPKNVRRVKRTQATGKKRGR